MLIREQLGGVLRDIRTGLSMTLGDVRDGARVSMAHLSELERGKTEPSSEIIRTLTDFYGVSQADLFREVSTRMAASDSLNGTSYVNSVEGILFGDEYAVAGFEQTMGNEMPDIRNVMPVAPDHVPDDLLAPETVDIDLSE
ncbi:MAG: hypothetical protein RLZ72_506 [Actinomycetota bacterium]